METEINSLDILFEQADERIKKLFENAEEEKRKREHAQFLQVQQMKADLDNMLRRKLPAVVMDYISFREGDEDGDFVDNAMQGIYLVVKLPEALPINISAFYNYMDRTWYVHEKYFIHREDGGYVGTHDNFLLAVGAAREHYRLTQ